MSLDVLITLLAAIISTLLGSASLTDSFQDAIKAIIKRFGGKDETPTPESYTQRLTQLTENLIKSSSEVDSIFIELSQVTKDRESTIQKLQAQVAQLEDREKKLQKRIEHLKDVPIPVADYFANIIESGEKRSAWRDYILFGLGVVVSTIIAIILSLIGLG